MPLSHTFDVKQGTLHDELRLVCKQVIWHKAGRLTVMLANCTAMVQAAQIALRFECPEHSCNDYAFVLLLACFMHALLLTSRGRTL